VKYTRPALGRKKVRVVACLLPPIHVRVLWKRSALGRAAPVLEVDEADEPDEPDRGDAPPEGGVGSCSAGAEAVGVCSGAVGAVGAGAGDGAGAGIGTVGTVGTATDGAGGGVIGGSSGTGTGKVAAVAWPPTMSPTTPSKAAARLT
jgi:hypothetical protein